MRKLLLRLLLFGAFACQAITVGSGCDGMACGNANTPGSRNEDGKLRKKFHKMNGRSAAGQHRESGTAIPFVRLNESTTQSQYCCKNGGTCILRTFCACPPHFTGRSCEHDTRLRNCGPIPHAEWVQKGCSYCRCGYGVLYCFPGVFHKECDDSEEVHWFPSNAQRTLLNHSILCLVLLLSFLL